MLTLVKSNLKFIVALALWLALFLAGMVSIHLTAL
jgi:hypothetical protein